MIIRGHRSTVFALAGITALLAGANLVGQVPTSGQKKPGAARVIAHDVAPFMQRKLEHAKNSLEGLVLRDFERIATNAQQISLMSLDTTWQVLQSPEYATKSAELRVVANELAEAAKAENLDAATLAYVKMTMTCVDCHKHIEAWQTSNVP